MPDVVIAGVFTLVGVLASGGVQTGLAIRADRRLRRGAIREIRTELIELTQQMVVLASGDEEFAAAMQAASLPEPEVYRRHSALAAQGFSESQWQAVSDAYARYDMVRRGLTADVPVAREFTAAKILPMAIEESGNAALLLVPRRQRKDDQRGLSTMKGRAAEIARGPNAGSR